MRIPGQAEPNRSSTPPPILETRGLRREINGSVLVDGVTMAVARGDVVAIVGPSGSGKSSLLRLLNRLDEPSGGEIFVDGQDYRQIAPQALRRRVGMLMQLPYLFPGTVAENICFGPQQQGNDLPASAIAQLLTRVGLPGFSERDVAQLSGGEAQRVALARTLANEPEILLLDEPTSALDENSRTEVEALLLDIMRDRELTCLLVTHDLDQADRMATRTLFMEKGQIRPVNR